MIHNRIKNSLQITLHEEETTDLTKVTGLEFYIKQVGFFKQYTPTVISAHEMLVTVPLEDAMQLYADSSVQLQFAFTDVDGNPRASEKVKLRVRELLKETGYAAYA